MKKYFFPGLVTFLAALGYFSFAVFILNTALVIQTFFASTSLSSKLSLYQALLFSSWDAFGHTSFFLLVITAFLVGVNVTLSISLLQKMQKMGNLSFSMGGGTFVGVFSAGCSSCGFSALSLFGLSGTVALFPLHGAELYILAISLLTLSLYYNITKLQKPLVCSPKIKRKQ
jgi:hypothetical protein